MIPILWAALIAVATACGGAYLGWDYRDGKVAQEVATAQKTAIDEHNEAATRNIEATYAAGQRNAKARNTSDQLRSDANAANQANPFDAKCRLDPERRRVLNTAIDNANGDQPATGRVPESVRKTGEAGK